MGATVASFDVLKSIVKNGCDLTVCKSLSYDVLRELANLAQESGARLTITTSISPEIIRELAEDYGNSIGFIDGLDQFKGGKN